MHKLSAHATIVVILVCTAALGFSQEIVSAPSNGSINFRVGNDVDSASQASNVRVVPSVSPPEFATHVTINLGESDLGPTNLQKGTTHVFSIAYEIADGAPEEQFSIDLEIQADDANLFPKSADRNTSVNHCIAGGHFLVENEKLIFSRPATAAARKRAFSVVHACEPPTVKLGLALTANGGKLVFKEPALRSSEEVS